MLREQDGHVTKLAELQAGEYFGEMALINNTWSSAKVRGVAPGDVICLPRREFLMVNARLSEARRSASDNCRPLLAPRDQI